MKQKIIIIISAIALGYAGFLHLKLRNYMRIGVVNMDEYVYSYKGMKDASENYAGKLSGWNSKADSLKNVLQELYKEIQLDSLSKDKSKLQNNVKKFELLGNSYMEYQKKMELKAKEEDESMTIGILNQLNVYMKQFAEQEGYDLIITNTQEKNVGYVKPEADLTKALIEFANAKYNNEK